jgi:hypothetical protein
VEGRRRRQQSTVEGRWRRQQRSGEGEVVAAGGAGGSDGAGAGVGWRRRIERRWRGRGVAATDLADLVDPAAVDLTDLAGTGRTRRPGGRATRRPPLRRRVEEIPAQRWKTAAVRKTADTEMAGGGCEEREKRKVAAAVWGERWAAAAVRRGRRGEKKIGFIPCGKPKTIARVGCYINRHE